MNYQPSAFVHAYPPQRVLFGSGRANAIELVLGETGVRRAALVCGANTSRNRAMIEGIVAGAGGRIALAWDGVRPHAPIETVDALVTACQQHQCDGFVSLGGGSAHDTMRAAALSLQSGRSVGDFFAGGEAYACYAPNEPSNRIRMAAIPTTLSAAETTFGGGLTRATQKHVFYGDPLYIDHIILDPDVFATTPSSILIETGLNAINHAVERLCSPAHQPIADAQFIHALKLLLPSLPRLPARAGDGALIDAMIGAHLSQSTNVLGGVGHAVAHVLGGMYKIPHGVAHGLGLIPGLRFAGPANLPGVAAVQQAFRAAGFAPAQSQGLDPLIDAVRRYLNELGLPQQLRGVGIERGSIAAIARDVMVDISAARAVRDGLAQDQLESLLLEVW